MICRKFQRINQKKTLGTIRQIRLENTRLVHKSQLLLNIPAKNSTDHAAQYQPKKPHKRPNQNTEYHNLVFSKEEIQIAKAQEKASDITNY